MSIHLYKTLERNAPWLIFLALSLVASAELILGAHRPIPIPDAFDGWIVALKTTFDLLKSGLVAWDPNTLCGNQGLLRGFSPFNPFSLLNGLLPLWAIYSLWDFLKYACAGYGMYLYLFRILNLSSTASYFGGSLFLVSSFYSPLSEVFNYALPLFLFIFHKLVESPKEHSFRYGIFLLIITTTSFFPLTIPFIPILHLILILTTSPQNRLIQSLYMYCVYWLLYTLFHAPTVYSLLSEMNLSHRMAFEHLSSPSWISLRSEISSFIRGIPHPLVIGIFISLISVLSQKFKKIAVWWLCIFSFFFMGFFLTSIHIPILKSFQWQRLFAVTSFFIICVLAAYGWEYAIHVIQNRKKKLFYFVAIATGWLILTFDMWKINWMNITQRDFNLIFYLGGLGISILFIISPLTTKLHQWISCHAQSFMLICMATLLLFIKIEYFSVHEHPRFSDFFLQFPLSELKKATNQDTPFRAIYYTEWNEFPNSLLTYHNGQTPGDYQSMYPLRYKKVWLKGFIDLPNEYCMKRWIRDFSQWGNRVSLIHCREAMTPNEDLLSLMNVSFLLTNVQDLPMKYFKPLSNHKRNSHIYENTSNLPRAWIVSNWEIIDNEDALLGRLITKTVSEHLSSALLFSPDIKNVKLPKLLPTTTMSSSDVIIDKYSPNHVTLHGASPQEGILILSDNYHRNWKASVNGNPSTLFPANYIFRGVRIPKGDFKVEFKYNDPMLRLAYGATFFSILLFYLLISGYFFKRSSDNDGGTSKSRSFRF